MTDFDNTETMCALKLLLHLLWNLQFSQLCSLVLVFPLYSSCIVKSWELSVPLASLCKVYSPSPWQTLFSTILIRVRWETRIPFSGKCQVFIHNFCSSPMTFKIWLDWHHHSFPLNTHQRRHQDNSAAQVICAIRVWTTHWSTCYCTKSVLELRNMSNKNFIESSAFVSRVGITEN